jgi:catechol 2,3-dioxygenase-like lactoylglutathione lyase family enzyme
VFLGLRTVIYPSPDLAAAKAWWTELLGFEPYFDEPFFVGFNVEGYELALDPNGDPADGPTTLWGVADIDAAAATMLERGATLRSPITDVGDSIRVASFADPTGNTVGLIENPHFVAAPPPVDLPGPGR